MKYVLAKVWKFLSLPKNLQLFIMRIFQDQFLVGVTGIIFNSNNEVLLFHHSYRKTEWSLPGGYMKAGEHPKEALAREIYEESGMIIHVEKQIKIKTDPDTARLDLCFGGTYIKGEFCPSAEVDEVGFFTFENLPSISDKQMILIDIVLKKRLQDQMRPKRPYIQVIKRWFHRFSSVRSV